MPKLVLKVKQLGAEAVVAEQGSQAAGGICYVLLPMLALTTPLVLQRFHLIMGPASVLGPLVVGRWYGCFKRAKLVGRKVRNVRQGGANTRADDSTKARYKNRRGNRRPWLARQSWNALGNGQESR